MKCRMCKLSIVFPAMKQINSTQRNFSVLIPVCPRCSTDLVQYRKDLADQARSVLAAERAELAVKVGETTKSASFVHAPLTGHVTEEIHARRRGRIFDEEQEDR
jgi:hypothetical protein